MTSVHHAPKDTLQPRHLLGLQGAFRPDHHALDSASPDAVEAPPSEQEEMGVPPVEMHFSKTIRPDFRVVSKIEQPRVLHDATLRNDKLRGHCVRIRADKNHIISGEISTYRFRYSPVEKWQFVGFPTLRLALEHQSSGGTSGGRPRAIASCRLTSPVASRDQRAARSALPCKGDSPYTYPIAAGA